MILGRVVAVCRFRVKSMAGEALDAADLHWTGLAGDRGYAFVRAADQSHFPWLTARQVAALVRHRASYAGGDPLRPPDVLCPDGRSCPVHDPALAAGFAEAAGEPVRLMRLGRGAYDAMPVSVLRTTDAAAVDRAHGSSLGVERYRSNLVVEPDPQAPSDWTGLELRIGDARLRADWPIPRCAMITVDPATAARDPSVLRVVARDFANRLGTYCSVAAPGTIRRGDLVHTP